MTEQERPIPEPDGLSQPFFDAAREGRLKIQRCKECGTYQLPGRFACDECLAPDPEWVEASGRGTVYTYTVVHQKYHPAFEAPYNVILVELDEGPRLVSSLVGVENDRIEVGMRVEVEFEEVGPEISLPRFRAL